MSGRQELEAMLAEARAAGDAVHALALDLGAAPRALAAVRGLSGVVDAAAATMADGNAIRTLLIARIGARADPAGTGDATRLGTALAAALGEFDGKVPCVGVATSAGHGGALDDMAADELIAVAIEGLDVAQTTDARSAVHSELYELTVARLRRTRATFELDAVEPARAAPLSESDDPFAHQGPVTTPISAEAIGRLGGAVPDDSTEALQSRAVAKLRTELASVRGARAAAEDAEHAEHSRLERRIQKLVTQLEAAEAERNRLREERERDPGVASSFREVQGLPRDAAQREARQSMLDGVFRLNRSADAKG